jgi:hypothetical protein
MNSINTITLVLTVVLGIMLMLLLVLGILAAKSKSQKKHQDKDEMIGAKDTKKAKTAKSYSTESVFDFMEFDKIEDNMIITKNGVKYIMVVECQGVNYDLMSQVEKNSVEEGFIQFLNTLRHPVQIYTQTRTINLEGSIQTYRAKVEEIENELEKEKRKYQQMLNSDEYTDEELKAAFFELTKTTNLYEYGKDIIYTTEKMSLNKNVLNQKYYVVIPYYSDELGENDFDQKEITSLAFSELYTRAQSVIRTLGVCGVNGRILDSNSLADLLYVAYNRDDAEVYGIDKAIQAGYDELYSTAPDVLDKKMKALNEKIEQEAFEKANEKVLEAKSDKEKALEKKEESMDDLIAQMAKLIIDQNKNAVGKDIAQSAIEKINQDTAKRKGRPRKQSVEQEEEGTEDNE